MQRLPLPTTKTNLLRVKANLALAQEGRQLLAEKRDVILRELFSHMDEMRQTRGEAADLLAHAYRALAEMYIGLGRDQVARAAPTDVVCGA